jgi:biopolymer transport protein ExbD
MRRRRMWSAHRPVELNVIPLIDVVFFLLVFYVISTSFTPESAVTIERPQSTQASTSESPSLQVAVTVDDEVIIAGQSLATAQIATAVNAELARLGTSRVVVVADRRVPTGILLTVMDACSAGGASSVDVAATISPAGGSGP